MPFFKLWNGELVAENTLRMFNLPQKLSTAPLRNKLLLLLDERPTPGVSHLSITSNLPTISPCSLQQTFTETRVQNTKALVRKYLPHLGSSL